MYGFVRSLADGWFFKEIYSYTFRTLLWINKSTTDCLTFNLSCARNAKSCHGDHSTISSHTLYPTAFSLGTKLLRYFYRQCCGGCHTILDCGHRYYMMYIWLKLRLPALETWMLPPRPLNISSFWFYSTWRLHDLGSPTYHQFSLCSSIDNFISSFLAGSSYIIWELPVERLFIGKKNVTILLSIFICSLNFVWCNNVWYNSNVSPTKERLCQWEKECNNILWITRTTSRRNFILVFDVIIKCQCDATRIIKAWS